MSKASYKTNREFDFNDKNESDALRIFGWLILIFLGLTLVFLCI